MKKVTGDEVIQVIREYLTEQHPKKTDEIKGLAEDASLFKVGLLDSISFVEFITYLERQFELEIPPEDFHRDNFETMGAIAEYLKRRS